MQFFKSNPETHFDALLYPEMGVYGCYVGKSVNFLLFVIFILDSDLFVYQTSLKLAVKLDKL